MATWLPWALCLLLLLWLLWLYLSHSWRRWRRRRKSRSRARRARRGELDAVQLLLDEGFDILQEQVPTQWQFAVDGEPYEVELRADLLVEREGLRYIAEVKTGSRAPNIGHAPTRRQLIEYALAYDVDAVLLIDMERASIQEVEFW